jgi:hypothetical protein
MIDEVSAEDIRIAKQHLERALARAINRDSIRWNNPPTYVVTDDVPQGTYYAGFDPEAFVDLDEPRLPEYSSLAIVPVGTVVRDRTGDDWKIKPDGSLRLRFKDGKKWKRANVAGYPLTAWDSYAPFTEVKG